MSSPLIVFIRRQSPNVDSASFYKRPFDIPHQLVGATSKCVDHGPRKTGTVCDGSVDRMSEFRGAKKMKISKAYAVRLHIFLKRVAARLEAIDFGFACRRVSTKTT
jgi:hypothetical protein